MDVENHPGMVVPRSEGCSWRRSDCGWATPSRDIGAYPHPVPDAMHDYLDPPTAVPQGPNRTTFRIDEVVPVGTEVPTSTGTSVAVTGPPQAGLPDGAARETGQWFSTVRVPVRAEPAPGPGRSTGALPTNTLLIGEGRGRTVRLEQDPGCSGALASPFGGCACYAVPDGFEARYLVLRNDEVAVDLRPTGAGPRPPG